MTCTTGPPGTMVGMVTNGTMAGVFDEWNDDWSSVGWHEGWEQTYDTSASSFSLGGLDVSATSSPKRFEWVKMNLDTGGCSEHIPIELWSRRSRRWKILSDCQW